ncbi:hypothetical protein BT93_L1256 [Corymbia citriodora subsp. variegata]|uniref:Uncharacterized protein n=1 Tax=Corymbia citriodora subsp. variegata TaxID=360336 RepID=A0A8T0CT18_CORYI|nr:hypothetical protein BT93_L1256 [Corymbia citriodora subsp. variegata]
MVISLSEAFFSRSSFINSSTKNFSSFTSNFLDPLSVSPILNAFSCTIQHLLHKN